MSLDAILTGKRPISRPQRFQRTLGSKTAPNVVDVGPGTKWANPVKKRDVDALVSSEPDIEEALNRGGWKAAAVILYRDHLLESRPRSHRAARQGSILHLQAYRPVPRRCAY